jgi:radical SAM superfamily enzyme YgiQ (UPF0313 family)
VRKLHVQLLDLKSYYLSPAYQLGLLAAYAQLEEEVRKNVEFHFSEHPREQSAGEIADLILASGADVVAASNYAWNHKKICQVLDILTTSGAKLPLIILGGPNSAGRFGEEMLERYPIVSALVEGEGEPAFRDICSSLVDGASKDPFAKSRNCVIRTEGGGFARPNINHRIQLLDDIPSPYLTGLLRLDPSPLFYETNRGCPYRCSFCYWGNGNSRVYRMSHERIREEMEFLAKNRVSSFWIADANFGIFPDDAAIAEILAELNARHHYPFKHVGVNWAKNSSDRVLEIASIFKRGRMGCTTTLALQSVTGEAEEKSRRYSMAPSKFVNLMKAADALNVDTYTDIIWGLPGESVEEYLNGLDTVVATGVPSILIHQLYLLPGTEFFDDREKFGLKMLNETGEKVPSPDERSDYWDYIVVSHPKMSRDDMIRGTRILGISHILHNHDLGKVVGFYLARYGASHRDIYTFFDDLVLGRVADFPEEKHPILVKIRELILTFANTVGLDEFIFYRKLSELIWFRRDEGRSGVNEPAVRAFMHDFFLSFCRRHGICDTPDEQSLLREFVDYNILISPKPAWRAAPSYTFAHDVNAMWADMLHQILTVDGGDTGASRSERATARGRSNDDGCIKDRPPTNVRLYVDKAAADARSSDVAAPALFNGGDGHSNDKWHALSTDVRTRVARLLSNEYVARMQGPVTYTVKNPWTIPPSQKTSDWLLSNRSKHCIVTRVAHVSV